MHELRRREQGGAQGFLLLLVFVGVCGAGAWNYQRNLQAERAEAASRPLSGYATQDLEALADAYRQEIAAHSGRYEQSRKARSEARDRSYFADQVREFERVQRDSDRQRAAGGEVAVREAALRDVEAELATRGPDATEWEIHLRRLTTF